MKTASTSTSWSRTATAKVASSNSSLARWLRRRASRHVSDQAAIIIGGSPRSGTTLLRVMLDSHPGIACGPESSLLTGGILPERLARCFDTTVDHVWTVQRRARDHAHFIDLFMTDYARRRGKQRWAEKTPQNVRHLRWIFAHWPRAKFIHVVRDGRDAVCSIRTHPRVRMIDGRMIPTNARRPLESCVRSWLRDTGEGLRWRGHANYHEVRYEDLVTAPMPTLRKVCAFLGVEFSAVMLQYYKHKRDAANFIANVAATEPLKTTAVGRWRNELRPEELELFEQLAGPRMNELGYR